MVTTTIIIDTRREKKNGKFPLKLRVIYEREVKYYPAEIDTTAAEYDKLMAGGKLPAALRSINDKLVSLQAKANEIIQTVKPFSFVSFERKMGHKSGDRGLLETIYKEYLEKLRAEDRENTADSYQGGLTSLLAYRKNLRFNDVTQHFLNQYEQWMVKEDKHSLTTVGIYLRPLRAVFNIAIEEGIVSKDQYPFGKGKYQIPVGKNTKKALQLSDIGKIYYYEPVTRYGEELRAKDFWLFSYFANGMNMKDIALLKEKNIDGDYIRFTRAKTKLTARSKPQTISVYMNADIQRILLRWGNTDRKPDDYIFPILCANLSSKQQKERIKGFIKNVNAWMKDIAANLGITKPVTTYVARHSFSTVLKRSGASTEYISEALGHADIKTTANYLDSFEDDTKKQFSQMLTAFKKNDAA